MTSGSREYICTPYASTGQAMAESFGPGRARSDSLSCGRGLRTARLTSDENSRMMGLAKKMAHATRATTYDNMIAKKSSNTPAEIKCVLDSQMELSRMKRKEWLFSSRC